MGSAQSRPSADEISDYKRKYDNLLERNALLVGEPDSKNHRNGGGWSSHFLP